MKETFLPKPETKQEKAINDGIDEYREEYGEFKSRPKKDVTDYENQKDNEEKIRAWFDRAKEIRSPREILQYEAQDRREMMKSFSRVLHLRYQGAGKIREELLRLVEQDPDRESEYYLKRIFQVAREYSILREMVEQKVRAVVEGYVLWRSDLVKAYQGKNAKEILDEAYKADPYDGEAIKTIDSGAVDNKVVCRWGPFCVKIRIDKKTQKETGLNKRNLGGKYRPYTKSAFDYSYNFFQGSKESGVMRHEEQHAIYDMLNQKNEDSPIENALSRAKDEILARLREGENGLRLLEYTMLKGGVKRFFPSFEKSDYKEYSKVKPLTIEALESSKERSLSLEDADSPYSDFYKNLLLEEEDDYEKILVSAINSARELRKRYGTEQLIGILSEEDLRNWEKLKDRT
jgi:hypothetical protein